MQTCKTCKFWTRLGWPDDLWGVCERTVSTKGAAEDNETLAWVDSDSKQRAWLNTFETFGCTQYAEKPDQS